MTEEDIKYRQGRSKKQYESNMQVTEWVFILFILFSLGSFIYNAFK